MLRTRTSVAPFAVLSMLVGFGASGLTEPCEAQSRQREPLGIPYKPDPPVDIDGNLGEWANIPNAQQLDSENQVVAGRDQWTSSDDLSATVWLAWRHEHLYLAVDVTDDRLRQTKTGRDMWRGDHVELYVDMTPDSEPERDVIGHGQFQLGFSPGNFQNTGDPLVDLKPEAVVYIPPALFPVDVLVAAKRTEKGYTLEAAVPWKLLNAKVDTATPVAVEVAVSDTDGDEPVQETMMTILATPWERQRNRLVPAILSPADGKAPVIVRGFDMPGSANVKPSQKQEFNFTAPATPAGREAILTLKARLDSRRPAGYTHAMRLQVNGKPLDGTRLVNKKPTEERVNGSMDSMAAGDRFAVAYAPNFEAADKHLVYGLKRAQWCLFEMRVTDLLKQGDNALTIENAIATGLTHALIVETGRIEFRPPIQESEKKGPPTGPLPVITPARLFKVDYTVSQKPNHDLLVSIGGESFVAESRFSTPEPKWQKASNRYFTFQRRIEKRDEAIIVYDTFTNLTDENLPLMQEHRVVGPFKKAWLAGLSPAAGTGSTSEPSNPTSFGITDKVGIGLMPMDDVLQVHSQNFGDGKSIGLADHEFVLKPKATHAAEWTLLPVAKPDYFAFVNSARRLRDVNFTIDGSFAFLRTDPRIVGKWSDDEVADFIRNKSVKYLCIGVGYPRYKGRFSHGTSFQTVNLESYEKERARRRRIAPDIQQAVYFHCFIDALEGADKLYPADRVLRSDGTHTNYRKEFYPIFFPTHTNKYGRNISKSVDIILDKLGMEGVYWDELEYSMQRYHYGKPWDGVSADINLKSMQIAQLKSSVTLITQPWREAMVQRILKQGVLVGNGAPHTRTMTRFHFPRFVETGSISNCARNQIYTPIALGDHLTERSELDAYRVMLKALDYGCVYYWYNDVLVVPTHPHLTKYMFPITPMELGEGYIIGTERIITKRSGLYGWNDNAQHEVHVFDDRGYELADFKAPAVTRDGNTFTELRIGEDFSAAIIRKR